MKKKIFHAIGIVAIIIVILLLLHLGLSRLFPILEHLHDGVS